jgi:vacuolar-type H+-ATPase subunit E/Vma4
MALQHILDAIVADADNRISEAKAEHKQLLKTLKEEHEKRLHAGLRHIQQEKDKTKAAMRSRAQAKAHMIASHALLKRKQELLDGLYAMVIEDLKALPAGEAEAWIKRMLDGIADKGVIHPAKPHADIVKKAAGDKFEIGYPINSAGGFRFEGIKQDRDCTLEFLVTEVLRQATELDAAKRLFSKA